MYTSDYNFPSGYLMSMGVEKLVGLRRHGVFYTGFICKGNRKGVAKVIVGICIPILCRNRTIWNKVLLNS